MRPLEGILGSTLAATTPVQISLWVSNLRVWSGSDWKAMEELFRISSLKLLKYYACVALVSCRHCDCDTTDALNSIPPTSVSLHPRLETRLIYN